MIYYDQGGQLRAIGAEILDPETNAEAADEGWIKVAWQVCNPGSAVSLFTHNALTGSSYFSGLKGPQNSVFIVLFPQTRRKKMCSRITSNTSMTAAGTLSRTHIRTVCSSGNPCMGTHNSFSATQPPGVGNNTMCSESAWFKADYSPTPIRAEWYSSVRGKRTCTTSCATDMNWV